MTNNSMRVEVVLSQAEADKLIRGAIDGIKLELDQSFAAGFAAGRDEGTQDGYEVGYDDGFEAGYQDARQSAIELRDECED